MGDNQTDLVLIKAYFEKVIVKKQDGYEYKRYGIKEKKKN